MNWLKRIRPGKQGVPGEPVVLAPATPKLSTPTYTRYRFEEPSLRIAAIGDIHGRIDLLEQIAAQLDELRKDPDKHLVEVFLGDYIDRGGNPKAIIDFLIERTSHKDRDIVCLAGNHEHMMLAALENDKDFLSWLAFGGHPTLLSYGVSLADVKSNPTLTRTAFRNAVPDAHVAFLKGLDLSYQKGGFMFVHAGVKPNVPLHLQKARDMLWIREEFMRSNADFGAVVVHGHTPVPKPVFRPNRISIDTGAYGSGILTCLTITSEVVTTFDTQRRLTFA